LALVYAAQLSFYRRDEHAVHHWAEAAMEVCAAHEFPVYLGMSTVLRGWALVMQGQGEEGVRQIEEGIATAPLWLPHIAMQTEAYALTGQVAAGLSVVEEELTRHKREESWYDAELYRLKGELTLQQESKEQRAGSREQEAEACFLKAIDIAQKQQAKSLELRAVMSLVRLRQRQAKDHAPRSTHHESRGTLAEAHRMLSEIYHWFTEGFDTKDLQEAKALLYFARAESAVLSC
jgi:hypothetical protein